MGSISSCICNSCGTEFGVTDGGGFEFHTLRCDRCGSTESIGFDDIGEPHDRYLKGLGMAYSAITEERDRERIANCTKPPLTPEGYQRCVEELVGEHECGGQFRFDAPARCPKCRSTDFRHDPNGDDFCFD